MTHTKCDEYLASSPLFFGRKDTHDRRNRFRTSNRVYQILYDNHVAYNCKFQNFVKTTMYCLSLCVTWIPVIVVFLPRINGSKVVPTNVRFDLHSNTVITICRVTLRGLDYRCFVFTLSAPWYILYQEYIALSFVVSDCCFHSSTISHTDLLQSAGSPLPSAP